MTNFTLIALGLFLVTPAFAAPKSVSLSEFGESARMEQNAFDHNECFITVKQITGGLVVTAEDDKNKAEFLVKENDTILESTKNEADGSFLRTFEVAGVGSFRAMHADDAFEYVEVTAGGRTVKCETDL